MASGKAASLQRASRSPTSRHILLCSLLICTAVVILRWSSRLPARDTDGTPAASRFSIKSLMLRPNQVTGGSTPQPNPLSASSMQTSPASTQSAAPAEVPSDPATLAQGQLEDSQGPAEPGGEIPTDAQQTTPEQTAQVIQTAETEQVEPTQPTATAAQPEATTAAQAADVATQAADASSPAQKLGWQAVPELAGKGPLDASWSLHEIETVMMWWKYVPDLPQPGPDMMPKPNRSQYLTFEPDHGGWNNIRMQLEGLFTLAKLMHRTVVMPPRVRTSVYLLGESHITDFFSEADLRKWVDVISMEEFLDLKGLEPDAPQRQGGQPLQDYLCGLEGKPKISCPDWDSNTHSMPLPDLNTALQRTEYPDWKTFTPGHNGNYDVAPRPYFEYTAEQAQLQVLHFISSGKIRFFGNVALCLYFPSVAWQKWAYAGLRSYYHFPDSLVHNASSIIHALLLDVGPYNSVHHRTTDFIMQFPDLYADPAVLAQTFPKILDPNMPLFIATDKPNRTRLEPILKLYPQAKFLGDYLHLVPGTPSKYLGMLDQLVASAGRRFIATKGSTFSSYISRVRGYLPDIVSADKNYYFTLQDFSGDPAQDGVWTRSMSYPVEGARIWDHAGWARDFYTMTDLD